ncbi:MAG: hypothetical protein IJ141_05570 [Lachnospiraceae bacterium]|nr:hypothetical protein [Lachnospiraceae bacterium]
MKNNFKRLDPDIHWYCRALPYILVLIGVSIFDGIVLYGFYDKIFNAANTSASDIMTVVVTTLSIVLIIDIYSGLIGHLINTHLKPKFRSLIPGLALLMSILFTVGLMLVTRATAADYLSPDYELSGSTSTAVNILLGIVPLCSTFALTYLSSIRAKGSLLIKLYSAEDQREYLAMVEQEYRSTYDLPQKLVEAEFECKKKIYVCSCELIIMESILELAVETEDISLIKQTQAKIAAKRHDLEIIKEAA